MKKIITAIITLGLSACTINIGEPADIDDTQPQTPTSSVDVVQPEEEQPRTPTSVDVVQPEEEQPRTPTSVDEEQPQEPTCEYLEEVPYSTTYIDDELVIDAQAIWYGASLAGQCWCLDRAVHVPGHIYSYLVPCDVG
jgi:hypothetical protein